MSSLPPAARPYVRRGLAHLFHGGRHAGRLGERRGSRRFGKSGFSLAGYRGGGRPCDVSLGRWVVVMLVVRMLDANSIFWWPVGLVGQIFVAPSILALSGRPPLIPQSVMSGRWRVGIHQQREWQLTYVYLLTMGSDEGRRQRPPPTQSGSTPIVRSKHGIHQSHYSRFTRGGASLSLCIRLQPRGISTRRKTSSEKRPSSCCLPAPPRRPVTCNSVPSFATLRLVQSKHPNQPKLRGVLCAPGFGKA